jgi:hypothetical protein
MRPRSDTFTGEAGEMKMEMTKGAKMAAWSFMYTLEIAIVGGIGAAIHFLLGVPVVYVGMGWLALLGGAHLKRLWEAVTTNAHALKTCAEALDAELGRQAERITKLEERVRK